jgi:excisionase family DNA binding protein
MTKILTTSQAAARLGISRRRVAVLIKAGRLKATPLGESTYPGRTQPKAWLIAEEDLEIFAQLPRPSGGAGIKALHNVA